ncbi:MAG: aminotransferase class I/II-fold pyridoxal phosphate-dependent enzyme, partial [Flavobacteriaceae bacterium]|nr:aminotransferase class I/II-fold pyridoxal phosphate-dependent enzyme [Flavobacteriaceae bacterium]
MKTKVENLIRKNVKALKPYSSARDDFKGIGDNMVFLDANENPFDRGLNRYPDPNQTEVKVRISELKNISTDQLLIGNGSDEVLDLIVRVFCEPNIDKIMILPPTYGMYRVIAGINAVDVIAVNLDSKFQPKVKEILSAANETTKILFLCSPNNPSGNLMDKTKVEAILNGFEGIVVIDEAYADFSSESSWIQELDRFPNLIVTQTLSKAYGLAGIRLGMCFASPLIIRALNKIKPPYNVNALTQREALNKLRDSVSLNKDVDQILTERKLLEHE